MNDAMLVRRSPDIQSGTCVRDLQEDELHPRWEKLCGSTNSHSTVDVFWTQSESGVATHREPLPASSETQCQCSRERKVSQLPCFPLGGHFPQAVSGFGLASKCLCVFVFFFYPHCFSIMDWRARAQFSRSKGHRTALLSLSLAALTAGPSLTVPQEEMQIYRGGGN